MEHVISLAFDFDDDKVREIAEKRALSEMDTIIKEIVLDQIAPYGRKGYYGDRERNWSDFESRIVSSMMTIMQSKKDDIIELAATKLADSIRRTKAWKEKYGEVVSDE